jgi:hypothetical protein
MADNGVIVPPGCLGNLTAEGERKLQEAWVHLLRLCGVEESVSHNTPDWTNELRAHLSDKSTAAFRQRLWSFVLADHPDVLVLRFLRARKWDVEKAMAMLVSAINWRHERRLEEDIVSKGDSIGLAKELSADEKSFLAQYRSGKAYVRGSDKEGRPVFVIKVRLHDPKLQSPESMEAFILHNIETIRTMIRYPDEKSCLIFDLTGFGLKNMDFHVVKFLVQVFEARYPEYLGVVLVHNAPFIFWGMSHLRSANRNPDSLTSIRHLEDDTTVARPSHRIEDTLHKQQRKSRPFHCSGEPPKLLRRQGQLGVQVCRAGRGGKRADAFGKEGRHRS